MNNTTSHNVKANSPGLIPVAELNSAGKEK